MTLINSVVRKNSAETGNGGGITTSLGSPVTLINSAVRKNTAANNGGGIYTWRSRVNLRHSKIIANQASFEGGGIFFDGQNEFAFRDSLIRANKPDDCAPAEFCP